MIPVDCFRNEPWTAPGSPERLAQVEEKRILGQEIKEMRKRAQAALQKAIKTAPEVERLLTLSEPTTRHYYKVVSASKPRPAKTVQSLPLRERVRIVRHLKPSEYLVILLCDRDGRWFLDCDCPAGHPPADEYLGIIKWHPNPCYHIAAVLITFSKTARATEARRKQLEP